MKKYVSEFFRRGLCSCGLGPVVLAIIYLVIQNRYDVQVLSIREASLGIFSLTALAFLAGGLNILYQIERLPLMAAILIHGGTLYLGYLGTYLLNGWLEKGAAPILIFTGIFVLGYIVIWIIIYSAMKRKTQKLNKIFSEKQQNA